MTFTPLVVLTVLMVLLVLVDVFATLPAVVKRIWSPVTTTTIVVWALGMLSLVGLMPGLTR